MKLLKLLSKPYFKVTSFAFASRKEMSKERNTQIMRNDKCPPPKLKTYPYIELTGYALGSLSSITPKVFMVHDVCSCYMCKVGEIEYYEL